MDRSRRRRNMAALAMVLAVVFGACGSEDPVAVDTVAIDAVLDVPIPGTANPSISASGDTVTRLFDVTGNWVQVSVDLAEVVQREGWRVQSLNCVGTGNDVIAKKQVDGRWLLLESGAGERGAGIIVRPDPDQTSASHVVVSGDCPEELVDSVAPAGK